MPNAASPLVEKPQEPVTPTPPRLLTPQFLFITMALFGLLAFALSPRARRQVSVLDHGRWFLDSYAVLASSDAQRVGIDPAGPNPLDVFQRSHKYSDWWFVLGTLGLTREDNFFVGLAWVLGFLAAVFLTVKATGRAQAVWLALLVCSPPVLLGIIRANNDLVIFVLLAFALWGARSDAGWRIALTILVLALATGLKFYPAVAGIIFIFVRSPQRRMVVLVVAGLTIAATLAIVGRQIARGTFHIEPEIYTFGGRILAMDLGLAERSAAIASVMVLGLGCLIAARWGGTERLVKEDVDVNQSRVAALGSVLLLGCFAAGVNHGYRWIFALWLAPWLWANRERSRAARTAVWLLPVCLWHYAVLCIATALWFPNLAPERYDGILVAWRFATEPFTWLLLILLGGWLLNLALHRGREMRRALSTSGKRP
jgi:hypothetical protein